MIDPYDYVPFNAAMTRDKDGLVAFSCQGGHGDMPFNDLVYLDFFLNGIKKEGMVAYEIGAWTGMSTCCIGSIVKKCHGTLTTIDNFKGSNVNQSGLLEKVDVRGILKRNLKRFGIDDVVTILERNSDECDDIPDESIDFLFIDGDHRYTQVKKDIMNWYPKIKVNGFMTGHDYNGNEWKEEYIEQDAEMISKNTAIHHGINKAVMELFNEHVNVYASNGKLDSSIWIVEKDGISNKNIPCLCTR